MPRLMVYVLLLLVVTLLIGVVLMLQGDLQYIYHTDRVK